jgi:hypothetical protein
MMLSTAIKMLGLPTELENRNTQSDIPPTDNDQNSEVTILATPDDTILVDEPTAPINNETNHKTPLRITYNTEDETFSLIMLHNQLLGQIKNMDDKLIIYPNNKTIAPYADLNSLPTNDKDFQDQFTIHDTNPNRIIICVTIGLSQPFSSLKYSMMNNTRQDSTLLQFMKNNNIIARHDKFEQKLTTSIGFLLFINPDIVYRDAIHQITEKALNALDIHSNTFDELYNGAMQRGVPPFEINFGTVSYRSIENKTVTTKVLDINGAHQESQLLKELLCTIDFTTLFKKAIFVPRGLNQL